MKPAVILEIINYPQIHYYSLGGNSYFKFINFYFTSFEVWGYIQCSKGCNAPNRCFVSCLAFPIRMVSNLLSHQFVLLIITFWASRSVKPRLLRSLPDLQNLCNVQFILIQDIGKLGFFPAREILLYFQFAFLLIIMFIDDYEDFQAILGVIKGFQRLVIRKLSQTNWACSLSSIKVKLEQNSEPMIVLDSFMVYFGSQMRFSQGNLFLQLFLLSLQILSYPNQNLSHIISSCQFNYFICIKKWKPNNYVINIVQIIKLIYIILNKISCILNLNLNYIKQNILLKQTFLLIKQSKMFKQNNNTSGILYTMGAPNSPSQQSNTKQSQMQNFSKLLKKLQSENVNMDELRLLKTQHTYLEKLRNQRQKVQQLKLKYNQCEQNLFKYQQQNKNQSIIIQEYENSIQMLREQVQNEREQRIILQNNFSTKSGLQKQKLRTKVSEMGKQIEELKRIVKNRDIMVMQLEEQSQEKIKEVKQQFVEAKRKLIIQVQQRVKAQLQQKSQLEAQVMQLRSLVTRQNKALKQQNQKYQQLSDSHSKLAEQLQKCHQSNTNLALACEQCEQRIQQLEGNNESLVQSLKEKSHNAHDRGQLQELRKQMAEMAKGQIQKIEFIVNQFQ